MADRLYADYEVKPYVSAGRDTENEEDKPVPRRNMERLQDGLLAGDIILLWRIAFGTFTNETWFPKYFEYTYGIDAPRHLQTLIEKGFAYVESAFDSLNHITSAQKKKILQAKGVAGLSGMKAAQLDTALREHLSEEEIGAFFTVRGIALTEKGEQALKDNQAVIDRHPKKQL